MGTPPTPWERPEPLPAAVETERMVLRWWTPADAQALHEAVAEDRAALLPWLPWAAGAHADAAASAGDIERFTRLRAEGTDFTVGAFDRTTGAAIGGTGFHRLEPAAHEAEVGYWVRGSRQREGLATEMARAWISAGFSTWGFRRLHLRCAAPNAGSVGVLARLGLPREGCLRADRWTPGHGWTDTLVYGVLAEEWDVERQCMRARG